MVDMSGNGEVSDALPVMHDLSRTLDVVFLATHD
jgi:hypothetical protein